MAICKNLDLDAFWYRSQFAPPPPPTPPPQKKEEEIKQKDKSQQVR